MTYYVLQAAYTASKACGEYKAVDGSGTTGGSTTGGGTTGGGTTSGVSQLIVPVKIATPGADGKIFHEVQAGQSFWSIAVAYQITIKDIEVWNNISQANGLQIGQKLFIPGENTEGYATPTPVGMIVPVKPDKDGRVVHVVQAYHTLSTIATAYDVPMESILAYNGIQADWPLRIGQELIIQPSDVTPSPTPRPLTPIEKLTPASDGKYYHTVGSGETIAWIATLYEVNMFDLMRWNNLNESSILHPEDKLVLQVTPPATATFTPAPPTSTPTATRTATPEASPSATRALQAQSSPTVVAGNEAEQPAGTPVAWFLGIGVALAAGLFLLAYFTRSK
jgi:LysM repeat protein